MKAKPQQVCSECNRKRDRCRVVAQVEGELVYVCRACWRDLDLDHFMYEFREPKGYGSGV